MKNHLTICFLLVALSGFGQFNERFVAIPGPTENSSIHVTGDQFAVISRVFTESPLSEGFSKWHMCYSILDNQGTAIVTKSYTTGINGLLPQEDGMTEISENHLQCGIFVDTLGVMGAYYLVFNALGDTARFTTMYNPWYSDDPNYPGTSFMVPRDFYLDQQGYVFMSYGGQSGEFTASDAGVVCYGPDDTYQWHIDFIDWDLPEHIYSMTKLNGFLYFAVQQKVTDYVHTFIVEVHKVDMEGNIVQSWSEPWEFNPSEFREMISDDNAIVSVGSITEEMDVPSRSAIFKFDSDMNTIWMTALENNQTDYRRFFEDVTIATDGHYVASGQYPYELDEPDPVNGTFMSDVTLAKFHRDTGELLWQRFYRVVESEDKTHSVWDVRATADGGLIFCGESLDYTEEEYTSENPVQQGWVVKVDGFGCLVEGCQNSVEEAEGAVSWFKAGPNPLKAGTPLNVYLEKTPPAGAALVLTDMQGRQVATTRVTNGQTTYIWPLPEVTAATYLLSLLDGNKVLQVEKLQIIR
ncbi:MAG: T9SS type A sorting domain-containing protein [Cryomorphaceae bacterium]|nr:T9SS type A sorting domain-containing protein [Cryomorphaceae bacterium]